jgi:hypothetical protein
MEAGFTCYNKSYNFIRSEKQKEKYPWKEPHQKIPFNGFFTRKDSW